MKRREIFIELTSLLDVILIMMFILLTQAKTSTAQALDAAAEAQSASAEVQTELAAARDERDALRAEADEQRARADAEAERADAEAQRAGAEAERAKAQEERADAFQRQLWTENIVLDNSLLLTVSVDKTGGIRLETEDVEQTTLAYDWGDDTYARNRLRGLLLDKLKNTDREAVFLVFQYDRARIYHAEYDMIESIIQEVKQEARRQEIPLSILEMDIHEG